MIVYDGVKSDFLTSCENDSIAIEIEENILSKLGRHTPKAEFRSWENTLLVDEAHRLNEKSGMFHNMGENQIKEIIHAAYCSVFSGQMMNTTYSM